MTLYAPEPGDTSLIGSRRCRECSFPTFKPTHMRSLGGVFLYAKKQLGEKVYVWENSIGTSSHGS